MPLIYSALVFSATYRELHFEVSLDLKVWISCGFLSGNFFVCDIDAKQAESRVQALGWDITMETDSSVNTTDTLDINISLTWLIVVNKENKQERRKE